MAKRAKSLRGALDRFKGTDLKLERQKKLQKDAAKRKRAKEDKRDVVDDATAKNESIEIPKEGLENEEDLWTSEDGDPDDHPIDTSRLDDTESESDEHEDAREMENPVDQSLAVADNEAFVHEEGEDDIPLSDLSDAGSANEDIIPHQRLTINKVSALERALLAIALPTKSIPFSEHQSLTTAAPVSIPDIEDDLKREVAFNAQALSAVKEARALLKSEGIPFSRPADYFAEMVKSDEHMGKIKAKLMDDAANKKAAIEARRQRDLKKFGKQVQNEKLKERAKAKKDMMDKVNLLKRKRQGADLGKANEEDLFDVALEDAATTEKKDREARKSRQGPVTKRQKKDQKFGFGGKKRFAKSGDAISSADMSGYSVKKMKGQKTGASARLGKSRRAKQR